MKRWIHATIVPCRERSAMYDLIDEITKPELFNTSAKSANGIGKDIVRLSITKIDDDSYKASLNVGTNGGGWSINSAKSFEEAKDALALLIEKYIKYKYRFREHPLTDNEIRDMLVKGL